MRLSQLGWTQEMIGKAIGKDQSVVSRIMQNTDTSKVHNSYYNEGWTQEEIAQAKGVHLLAIGFASIINYLMK